MDKNSAVKLLDETFLNEFDIDRFGNFAKELFNNFELKQRDIKRYIPNEYTDFVDAFYSLGTYMDESKNFIQVFAVGLKRTSSRDRARTMQRNLIAKFLEKNDRDAALVAFYGDEPDDWRFSFVKMEYELVKEEGKVKAKTKLTPAKRSSYLVGLNEPNHTCRSQFLDLIMEEDTKLTLEQIEAAFSIESVTHEFFTKYKKLFLDLKESLEKVIKNDFAIEQEFSENNILTADFAKKLLGQIVFIYFLQKKGWLGVGRTETWGKGPKNFLRKLFNGEMGSYNNFFNDMLEPFFYEALATERDGDYYSRFKCKIPFLNGGLFEPANNYDWAGTDITLDNNIFKEILDTFDLFNFTIKEDEPLEKEVAVDPEMLGKVFENLLEVIDRKSKGAFYTPREIVHYMCQQSIINYLKTNISEVSLEDIEYFIQKGEFTLDIIIKQQEQKKKYGKSVQYKTIPESIKENSETINQLLKNIKVVDPAVGSGAFPVGMMNEIVRARAILSILSEIETKNYDLKRETIENCLYGVDIDSSAVDITKLRFWLSLVVDEEDIQYIKPLPNLDHKIMCGNSLIEEFEGMKLFDENLLEMPKINPKLEIINSEKEELKKELELLMEASSKNIDRITEIDNQITRLRKKSKKISSQTNNKFQSSLFASEAKKKLKLLKEKHELFFNAESPNKKKKLRREIEDIEWEFIEETLKAENNENAIDKLKDYKKNKSKPFFIWKLYFAEIFRRNNPGFDVVIANPPYVGEKGNKEEFRKISSTDWGNNFYKSKMDLFYFFFHKAIDLARENGSISFITTNYYITADGAIKLRKDFKSRSSIKRLINFNEFKIFDSAMGQHNMVTILIKKYNPTYFAKTSITQRKGYLDSTILNKIMNGNDELTNYYSIYQKDLFEGSDCYIRLEGTVECDDDPYSKILNKISNNSVLLGKICYINAGADVTISKITNRHLKNFSGDFIKGDGVFVLSPDELNSIQINDDEKDVIKNFIKNSNIKKYSFESNKDKLIYLRWEDNLFKYPNIKNHLLRFKDILKDQADRYGEDYPWFALHRPRDQNIFESKNKILVPYRNRSNVFGYSEDAIYSSRDVFFIRTKDINYDLKYILALLNSKLFYIWLYFKGKRKGQTLELYHTPLSNIPIKKITKEDQQLFINLIDAILSLDDYKSQEKKFYQLQSNIDDIVYDLYGLTQEEIDIVKNFNLYEN